MIRPDDLIRSPGMPGHGDVHLWDITLPDLPGKDHAARDVLSADERARAAGMRDEATRTRFLTVRALLRHLIGRYTGIEPRAVPLLATICGKPFLDLPGGRHLAFNLSHTPGRALIGLTGGGAIGVDIESSARALDPDRLARRYFTDAERGHLAALPRDERAGAFLTLWTRKEALHKAAGKGLTLPLSSAEVLGASPIAVEFDGARWHLADLDLGPRWRAAWAAPHEPTDVRHVLWDAGTLIDTFAG